MVKAQTLFGMDDASKINAVANFLDDLGLTPSILVTKDVVDLIYKSWQREFQREELSELKKQQMYDMMIRLSKRKRKPKPILDNMIPLNFQPLYDNVSQTYTQADKEQ